MNTHNTENYLTQTWLAAAMNCNESTLDTWRRRYGAPAVTVESDGRKHLYYERDAFLEWLRSFARKSARGGLVLKKRRERLRALENALTSLPVTVRKTAHTSTRKTADTQSLIALELSRSEVISLTVALRDHLDFALDSALDDGVDPMRAAKIRDIVRVLSRLHEARLHKANLIP